MTIPLNARTVNVILLMLITVVRVFMTNPVTTRCRRCRAMNFPVRTKQNKLRAKGGWQVNNSKYNYGKFSSNISLNS